MNREIKFRAWDSDAVLSWNKDGGRFLTPEELMDKAIWGMDLNNKGQLIYPHGIALMQYTGLTDKNGVEIYEADIVKYKGYEEYPADIEVIEYKRWGEEQSEGIGYQFHDFPLDKDIEVIGNIHQNPELLKLLTDNY